MSHAEGGLSIPTEHQNTISLCLEQVGEEKIIVAEHISLGCEMPPSDDITMKSDAGHATGTCLRAENIYLQRSRWRMLGLAIGA